MTRKEIAKLLNMLYAVYPNTKDIKNPDITLDAWELAFGDEEAERVYKAARVYMKKGRFFPSPADIVENINRGQMLYGETSKINETPVLTDGNNIGGYITPPVAPERQINVFCKGSCVCPYFEGDMCEGTKEEFEACRL